MSKIVEAPCRFAVLQYTSKDYLVMLMKFANVGDVGQLVKTLLAWLLVVSFDQIIGSILVVR